MNRVVRCLGAYAAAILITVVLFATTLVNESSNLAAFGIPIVLLSVAAHFSTEPQDRSIANKAYLQWVGWSVLGGILVGIMATAGI